MQKKIGFIGQGWIGKHYADDFEKRGFDVTRYALEEPYNGNGHQIKDCDIVFIAVPTPTTPNGFDGRIVKNVLPMVGEGKIAVIKSSILPGFTEEAQKENPHIFVFHSPEFLREASAAYDAANPRRNIIGMPVHSKEYKQKAEEIMAVLPSAPFKLICSSREAEFIKYAGNCFLYLKVIYANLLYDLSENLGLDYETVKDAIAADPRIGASHLDPIHASGRGAGGHCFIKDFAVFREMYEKTIGDRTGADALKAIEKKNIELLLKSNKDLDLLSGVYGEGVLKS